MKVKKEYAMSARIQEVQIQKLAQALQRLHDLLPLKERQDSLAPKHRELHRAILRSLIERGRPLGEDEIAKIVGDADGARAAVALLGAYDLVVRGPLVVTDVLTNKRVVLDGMGGEVVGAYPVTTEPTPHKVKVNGHNLYAMCAVDALAVGTVFDAEVEIDSVCHVTGEAVHVSQRRKEVLKSSPAARDLRVGVRWQRITTTAAHVLCRQMVFLKDAATAAKWQAKDPASIDIFTVPEAIDFGEAFFLPLLQD
jgi:mercuric reductase